MQEKYLKELTFKERRIFFDNIENMLFNSYSYVGNKILLGIFYYLIGIEGAISISENYYMPMGFFTDISESDILVALKKLEEGDDECKFFSIGFKFVHDFVCSKSENAELANKTVQQFENVLNENSGLPYTRNTRHSILTELKKITIKFLRKTVGLDEE